MLAVDDPKSDISTELVELSYAHVGLVLTDVPINVAHPDVIVGVMVLGKVILTMPVDVNGSIVVIFMR